jgi:hypothetical protein
MKSIGEQHSRKVYLFAPLFASREKASPMNKDYYWLSIGIVLARKIHVQSITIGGPVLFILYSADAVRDFGIQWFVQFSPAL